MESEGHRWQLLGCALRAGELPPGVKTQRWLAASCLAFEEQSVCSHSCSLGKASVRGVPGLLPRVAAWGVHSARVLHARIVSQI